MIPDTFSHYSVAQANVRQRCHKRSGRTQLKRRLIASWVGCIPSVLRGGLPHSPLDT